jgi:hypothetical protein
MGQYEEILHFLYCKAGQSSHALGRTPENESEYEFSCGPRHSYVSRIYPFPESTAYNVTAHR